MARQRHLNRAPVREALIDLHFDARLSVDAINKAIVPLASRYPTKIGLVEATVQFDGQDGSATGKQAAVGQRLEAVGNPFVLLARVGGITVSRLQPYGEWDELQGEAESVLGILHQSTGPLPLRRVAVRYINELRIPLPINDFADYLAAPPAVPGALPQALSKFMTRVILPFASPQCDAIVTQALESAPQRHESGEFVTILFDIDVFKSGQIQSDDSELWSLLGQLRVIKNQIFFEHLTEKALELFE